MARSYRYQKEITHYDLSAHTARPSSGNKAALAGAGAAFNVSLFTTGKKEKKYDTMAVITFWYGPRDVWPDDYKSTKPGDEYVVVHAPVELYAGVVDMLRNETNRYFAWDDPEEGRALAAIRTDVEPTGEGDTTASLL